MQRASQAVSDGFSRVRSVFSSTGGGGGTDPTKRKFYPSLWELPKVTDEEVEAVLSKTAFRGEGFGMKGKGKGRATGKGKGKATEKVRLRKVEREDEELGEEDDYRGRWGEAH